MVKNYGARFSQTATGTTGATATQLALSAGHHYITDISASSDLAGAVVVVRRGTTIIWEAIIAANTSYNHRFETPLQGGLNEAVSITVNATAAARANIAGFSL